jgi:hypothetical protein
MALESIAERLLALKAIAQDPNTQKRVSQAAAFRVIAEYKIRIFVDGLATDLQPIGQYSFTSFYINPNSPQLFGVSSSAIKPAGKTGQTTFKNGNPHKTKYLADGYSELRNLTGRQNQYVDLNFSGSLLQSIKVVEEGNVTKVAYTIASQADKMVWNETRFGKDISTVSEPEQQAGTEAAQLEFLAILEEFDLQ